MHIRDLLFAQPGGLMDAHRHQLADYVAQHFACPQTIARRGTAMLSGAEQLLRVSRLSQLCHRGAKLFDSGMPLPQDVFSQG